jgi:hypothetical protein
MRSRIFPAAVLTALCLGGTALSQPPPGGPPRPGGRPDLERILDDLRLDAKQESQARKAIDASGDKERRAHDDNRAELQRRLRDLLGAEQYRQFREAVDRLAPPGGPPGAGRRGVAVEDLVRHVMSFDRNGDGKVTRDELPERMHYLFELGDTNRDGALDRDELTRLAEKIRQTETARGPGPGGPGRPGGPGGPNGPGRAAPIEMRRALAELKLEAKQQEEARKIFDDFDEKERKVRDEARTDLLARLKDMLTAEQFTRFKEEMDRRPPRPPGGPGRRPPPP